MYIGNIEYVKSLPGKILNRNFNRGNEIYVVFLMIILAEVFFFDENQSSLGIFQVKTGQVIKTTNLEYTMNYFLLILSLVLNLPLLDSLILKKLMRLP